MLCVWRGWGGGGGGDSNLFSMDPVSYRKMNLTLLFNQNAGLPNATDAGSMEFESELSCTDPHQVTILWGIRFWI
jgi:hypothetical protein